MKARYLSLSLSFPVLSPLFHSFLPCVVRTAWQFVHCFDELSDSHKLATAMRTSSKARLELLASPDDLGLFTDVCSAGI